MPPLNAPKPRTGLNIVAGILSGVLTAQQRRRQQRIEDEQRARQAQMDEARFQTELQQDIGQRQAEIAAPILAQGEALKARLENVGGRPFAPPTSAEIGFETQQLKLQGERERQASMTERERLKSGRVIAKESDLTAETRKELLKLKGAGIVGNLIIGKEFQENFPGVLERTAQAVARARLRGDVTPTTTEEALFQNVGAAMVRSLAQDPQAQEVVARLPQNPNDPTGTGIDTDIPLFSGESVNRILGDVVFAPDDFVDLADLSQALAEAGRLEALSEVVQSLLPQPQQAPPGSGPISSRFSTFGRRMTEFPTSAGQVPQFIFRRTPAGASVEALRALINPQRPDTTQGQ